MNQTCPTCHQRIAIERLGIRLPPFKARLLDAIKAAGDVGISSAALTQEMYRGYSKPRLPTTIKAHVYQINDMLEATDWRIVSDKRGPDSLWSLQLRKRRRKAIREAAE